jgi:hypothetical protein
MPLYEVTAGEAGAGVKPRLIHASTNIGARSFAARDTIHVVKVTPMRVATLLSRGVKVENAPEESDDSTSTDAG